jgi:hypothetical protein
MTPQQQGRNDLVEYPLADNVRLEVYWRDDPAGYGPAASVYAYDQEILRLDCFGEAKKQGGKGHCHINLKQNRARQWMYRPGPVSFHVEQAIYDLRHNLGFCLATNSDERIQQATVDAETLESVAQQAEVKMQEFTAQLGLD